MNQTISLPLPDGRTVAIQLRVANLGRAWWVHPTAVTIDENAPPQPIRDVTRWVQLALIVVLGCSLLLMRMRKPVTSNQ
ncbi:MAG: hypothetical protein IPL28_23490 [Chloroflexi bacterium]|nr:hypothetical protein [Chloroflexota bacterium]